MKRSVICVALVCALVGMGAGEPATKPSSQPAESFPAMQRRLAEVMQENTALKAQVADLLARLEQASSELAAAKKVIEGPAAGEPMTVQAMQFAVQNKLKVGMTEGDVLKVLGKPEDKRVAGSSRVLIFRARDYFEHDQMRLVGRLYSVEVSVRDGVVVSLFDSEEVPQR